MGFENCKNGVWNFLKMGFENSSNGVKKCKNGDYKLYKL